MTRPSEAYMASLASGAGAAALDAGEPDVEREEGPAALARCLEARLEHEIERGAAPDVLEGVRRRAAAACEKVAKGASGDEATDAAVDAALRAAALFQEAEHDEGAERAAALALDLALGDAARMDRVVRRLGGGEEASRLVRRRLKSPEVKRDVARSAGVRRALSRLFEHLGDTDAAFFEMLGAVRKAPGETLYVDEAFRLALATSRFEEVSAVFRDLASDEALPARQRATLFNKLGHVAERGLSDLPTALAAYHASLQLHPESKGARRHKERLEALLREEQARSQPGPLLVERDPFAPRPTVRTKRPDESASLRSVEVTAPAGQPFLSPVGPSLADAPAVPSAESEPPVLGEEAPVEEVDEADVLEEAPSDEPFDADTAPVEIHTLTAPPSFAAPPPPPDDDGEPDAPLVTAEGPPKEEREPSYEVDGEEILEEAPAEARSDAEAPADEETHVEGAGDAQAIVEEDGDEETIVEEAVVGEASDEEPSDAIEEEPEVESLDALRARLEPRALEDAPHGDAFFALDAALADADDLEGRLELRTRAALQPLESSALAALLDDHATLLEEHGRATDALSLLARLALEVAPADEASRQRALDAFDAHASREERVRFLGRLVRVVSGEDGVSLVRRLLQERLALDDRVGAEAAARDLLERCPGDDEALEALTRLLEGQSVEGQPHRAADLVEILRLRLSLPKHRASDERRPLSLALVRSLAALERWQEVIEAAVEEHDAVVDEATTLLDHANRFREQRSLLERAASLTPTPERRADLLLSAARVARERLDERGEAEALVEAALETAPAHVPALLARADLAVELGDPEAALAPLERLAAEVADPKERARVHLRIGRLFEEHLGRPGDALKRYRAATTGDPEDIEAWNALRALARLRGDHALHVEALRGLCSLEEQPRMRAALLSEIARIERDERARPEAAERAFAEALAADPSDVEVLTSLLALMASRRMGEPDLEPALANPSEALLEEVYAPLAPVVEHATASGTRLALEVRRLFALSLVHGGALERGRALLEEILEEAPTDLSSLRALARVLEAGSDPERRLQVLEALLLHHAPDLDEAENVRLWGEVGALRWALGERDAARMPLRRALELASSKASRAALSDDAAAALVAALVDDPGSDAEPRLQVASLRLLAERKRALARAELLERAARFARDEAHDIPLCRKLLLEALEAAPDARGARELLLDLDLADDDVEAAIASTRRLLEDEADPKRKAAHHLRLATLLRRGGGADAEIASHLKRALRLAPERREVLDAAESFFEVRADADGLASLYAAQLKRIDPKNVAGRIALLERLAQVRRYDLRDLEGATEALEAIAALDPDAIKPREDCARLYTELGRWREAVNAWRAVLERDPLAGEAWRGLFTLYARTGQADEAFAVAATMTSVELADEEMARVVRRARPPFPRWPRAPRDAPSFRRKLGHPLERTPVRAVAELVGPRVHAALARPLKDFGLRQKDRLLERQVPSSVLLAVRTVSELIGLRELPPLYRAQLGSTEGAGPPFALLPIAEPGLVVSDEVLKGGMTPERAFALGRAMAWLMPHAILAGTLDATALRDVLEALVARYVPGARASGDPRVLEQIGARLEGELFRGLSEKDIEAHRDALAAALRDYVHAREQVHLADWIAGVGYTADRLGFLLTGDLAPATRVIKSTAARAQVLGARLAIKELVLFSASAPYLVLRRELGVALPDDAARPVVELA